MDILFIFGRLLIVVIINVNYKCQGGDNVGDFLHKLYDCRVARCKSTIHIMVGNKENDLISHQLIKESLASRLALGRQCLNSEISILVVDAHSILTGSQEGPISA